MAKCRCGFQCVKLWAVPLCTHSFPVPPRPPRPTPHLKQSTRKQHLCLDLVWSPLPPPPRPVASHPCCLWSVQALPSQRGSILWAVCGSGLSRLCMMRNIILDASVVGHRAWCEDLRPCAARLWRFWVALWGPEVVPGSSTNLRTYSACDSVGLAGLGPWSFFPDLGSMTTEPGLSFGGGGSGSVPSEEPCGWHWVLLSCSYGGAPSY